MRIPNNRRGFTVKPISDDEFFAPLTQYIKTDPLVYWNVKLTHNGITGYKRFENFNRKMHTNSLSNLLGINSFLEKDILFLVSEYKQCKNDDQRSLINDKAVEMLNQEQFDIYLQRTHQARHLNPSQSRKITNLCKKLTYYSQKRIFTSKKTGKYSMRVAFLTLTAPSDADPKAVCKAFNHFLDYLQRTANCVYVWKKELGDQSELLHFHLLINNFIPYYVIAWKWKRLLLAENVKWTITEAGADSNSHYRIELPRNAKQAAHYIAKYMSKAYDLPGEYGFISGHSKILDTLKELTIIEGNYPLNEINKLCDLNKVIRKDYVSIICCNLLHVKHICPELFALFESQYISFSQAITLPQKFHEV